MALKKSNFRKQVLRFLDLSRFDLYNRELQGSLASNFFAESCKIREAQVVQGLIDLHHQAATL
jgi:hypothetical protein